MALLRRSPFLTDDIFTPPAWVDRSNFDFGNKSHFHEDETSFNLSVDVPGVKAKDLKVEVVENNMLRVSGERKTAGSESTFVRSFSVDTGAMDVSSLKANLDAGVLTITVPKRAKTEPKSIAITVTEEQN